jgi:hypothetical protein
VDSKVGSADHDIVDDLRIAGFERGGLLGLG